MSAALEPLERCETCGGVYGAPDLAADPYDYPCTCPFPAEQAPVNAVLGERFTQEDGGSAWYSADGLHVLRTTPIRAAFNAPDGAPLYLYANADLVQPSQERELAAARAEIAYLQSTIVLLQDRLARVADAGADAAISRLQHDVAVQAARRKQLIDILETADLTPMARVAGALAAEDVAAHRLRLTVGDEPEQSAPQPINVADLERRAGIGAGKAYQYLGPVADAGLLTREVRRHTVESASGVERFRTVVTIGPGTGTATRRRIDPARQREQERKRAEHDARAAREAAMAAKIAELEQAQTAAAEAGCTTCAGPLLPTGYFCAACGEEHTVRSLAARRPLYPGFRGVVEPAPIPRIPGNGSYSYYTPDSGEWVPEGNTRTRAAPPGGSGSGLHAALDGL